MEFHVTIKWKYAPSFVPSSYQILVKFIRQFWSILIYFDNINSINPFICVKFGTVTSQSSLLWLPGTWSSLNNALKAKKYHKQSNRKGPFSVSNPVPYTVFLIIISHKVKGKNTVFQNHKTVKQ